MSFQIFQISDLYFSQKAGSKMELLENHLDKQLSEVLPHIQSRIKYKTKYFGIATLKNPFDNWIVEEIIFETKPDVIIEIGNLNGGSTLKLAHFCDLLNNGRVIGVDISHIRIPSIVKNHPRISLYEGDACDNFSIIKDTIQKDDHVMIIEDSSHTYDNTLRILRTYSCLIKKNDYIIIEDSICYHGLQEGPLPGPYEAIETFLNENSSFISDRSRESFIITWNPKGFLVRVDDNINENYNQFDKKTKNLSKLANKLFRFLQLFLPPIISIFFTKIKKIFNS